MNLHNNILVIILAIFAALPVLVIKQFFANNIFTLIPNLFLVLKLLILSIIIFGGYSYFIYKDISIVKFYPVIKLIEILVPVAVAMICYKEKLKFINYIGLLLTVGAIVCIEI